MKSTYSEAFVEQARVKVLSRGDRSIRSVADDLKINHHTLKNWMKKIPGEKRSPSGSKEKRPQDWRPEDQLVALHESHGLEGEVLQGWCRERGLFVHHLTGWKDAFCAGGKDTAPATRELGMLKGEIQQLKRELLRKEKALAEAAALLILQKKFQALWEDGVK